MMQAIVHVGDMKCGSKSIQAWLHQDAALLAEHGFRRSATTAVGIYDSRLASYALGDLRNDTEPRRECGIATAAEVPAHRQAVAENLEREFAALPTATRGMIFSHEMLLSLEPAEVDRLAGLLRRLFGSIRVVAYLRRQDRLILSLWGQRLKTHDPGPHFCDAVRERRSYLRMIDAWERAVGRENIVLRTFDKASFRKGDLQADFREAAGIPTDTRSTRPTLRNEGLDASAQLLLLELCDRLNARRQRAHTGVGDVVRRMLLGRAIQPWIPVAFPLPLVHYLMAQCPGRGLLPSRRWAEETAARHAQDNETIRRRYFPDRVSLFDDDFSAYPEEGGPPGTGCRTCDAADLAGAAPQPITQEVVTEAFHLVTGRQPSPGELAGAQRAAANVAHLYALLLERTRAARIHPGHRSPGALRLGAPRRGDEPILRRKTT
jgi:hypothetical protein